MKTLKKRLQKKAFKAAVCFCLAFSFSFVQSPLSEVFLSNTPSLSILDRAVAQTSPTLTANDQVRSQIESQIRSQIARVQSLQSLGFYRRALLQLEGLNLFDQPDTALKVDGLHLLSDLQRTVGDLTAATETIEAALAIAQKINTSPDEASNASPFNTSQSNSPSAIESTIEIAPLLLSLGHIAAASGQTEQALAQYERVDAIATTPQIRLRSHLSKLPLLQDIGSRQQVEALYSDIQTLIEHLDVSRLSINARLELARYQIEDLTENSSTPESNALSTAPFTASSIAQNLAIAQKQAHAISDSRAESYALGYLGDLYIQQQQLVDAQIALGRALAIAQTLNAADLAYQWQWSLGRVYRQQNQVAQALEAYEQAVQNLEKLRENLIAIIPDLQFDFKEKVEPVYREWVDLLLGGPLLSEQLLSEQSLNEQSSRLSRSKALRASSTPPENLRKAQIAIESLQLAELENFFKAPCIPPSKNINQLIESVDSPTAVLYPIILSDRLEILLKLPDQALQQYTVPIDLPALETLLTQLQKDLRQPFFTRQLLPLSNQLYDLLIRPTQTTLEDNQINTLVFVLDGALRNIPMAALYDGSEYLIENYSIALAPGLQMIAPQPLETQALTTLIAGLSEGRHGFSDLPFVKQEVSQIQQATNSRVLLNEDFTEARLGELLGKNSPQIVHLATHGQFSANAEDTFILAWDKPIKVDEFNALLRRSNQNYQQDRPNAIELLILSACETALGDRRAALGLAGIAVQAGARSTLATLWNLDDETGALFSDYFYQALQQPDLSKAQALRTAQLQMIRGEDANSQSYPHPRYWAPYVLLGNWL